MATYISLVQFTDKGIHAAKETTRRVADWAAKVQSKEVTIKQMYWTLGHYDQVGVFEAPNDETAVSVLSRVPRWRKFSPTFPDRSEAERSYERAGLFLLEQL